MRKGVSKSKRAAIGAPRMVAYTLLSVYHGFSAPCSTKPGMHPLATLSSFRWPDGARGAVSLSFDDGLRTHVENAIPTLNDYGFRGTFYIPMASGGAFDQRIDHWRTAASQGHEIGNHSMTHPCSANFGFSRRALDYLTLEDITEEILDAKRRITEHIPDQKAHSFAYPCGETKVGSGKSHVSYVPVVAEHYVVGRGIGDFANDPVLCDLACTWSFMPTDPPAERLIAWADMASNMGRWSIFCFHGVGGEHFHLRMEAFRMLLDHLAAHRDQIWTDTVINVGTWIRDHRERVCA